MSPNNPILAACGGNYNLMTRAEQRAFWDWERDEGERLRSRAHNSFIRKVEREDLDARIAARTPKRPKVKPTPIPMENRASTYLDRILNRIQFERQALTQSALAHSEAGIMSEERLDFEIGNEIDSELELAILTKLRANPSAKEIVLVLNSRGGWAGAAQNIFAGLAAHHAIKTGVVIGDCKSGAVLLLMACNIRMALAGSEFCVHKTSYAGQGEPTPADKMSLLASDHFEIVVAERRCKIDPERFKKLRDAARPFDVDEALDLKLIQRVADDEDITRLFPQDDSALTGDGEEIEIPETYEVQVGDNIIRFPLDRAKVLAVLRGGTFGLPSAYMHAARRIWGLPPNVG